MPNPAPRIRFFRCRDAYPMAARVWDVDAPRADVVFLHGIVSHGGWYLCSCEHLARCGFRVHFLERRGSGLNVKNRGDVDRWQTWLDDVEDYLNALPETAPRLLIGISWGGTLATAVARRNPRLLAGLGLSCPGLFSRKAPNWFQRIAVRALNRVGMKRRQVPIPLRDPALFTDSQKDQDYIARDPLTLWKITLSFAAANLELVAYATEHPEEIRVPTLLMLAGKDPITDNTATRNFVENIAHEDRQIVVYPDASHTLEFESDPSCYFADLTRWCERIATTNGRP